MRNIESVHLELTRTQTAKGFQWKLNAFITRKTRPERIISDNAATFKTTATWIKRILKSEKLQEVTIAMVGRDVRKAD